MDNRFWLILIGNSTVSASLVSDEDGKFDVISTGPKIKWDQADNDSIIPAVDQSLSAAGQAVNLPVEQEPENVSFITPPDWVGSDDEIFPEYKKTLGNLSKSMKLKPMGFIAYDEAIVEYPTYKDNSFILLHLHDSGFFCSLVYFGKIKNRVVKKYSQDFRPEFLEEILVKLQIESALPPQIVIFGEVADSIEDEIRNYQWLGKKNIETFLHSPSVQVLGDKEIINIFARFIVHHLHANLSQVDNETSADIVSELPEIVQEEIEELDPTELGFSSNLEEIAPTPDSVVELIPDRVENNLSPVTPAPKNPKFKFRLKIPSFKLKFNPFLYLLALSPLLVLIPLIFSYSDVDVFVNPYHFSQKTNIILDPSVDQIDVQKSIIPVTKQTVPLDLSASIKTTGKKIVGDKAKGEITIYNKSDKTQNIPKGTVLVDKSGKKFEVTNSVSVNPSVSNLDEGVINLGQTKIIASASDIGPEYNIPKGTALTFKEISESIMVSKVNESFTGGSKRDINAVSSEDKKTIEQEIKEKISLSVDTEIKDNLSQDGNIIKESIESKISQIEYNREIGEEADELKADVNATVSFLVLSEATKNNIVSSFLSSEKDFNNAQIIPKQFKVDIKINQNKSNQSTGLMEIEGNASPKIDSLSLQRSLVGKTGSNAEKIIRKNIPRAYNIIISHRPYFITFLNLMPFRRENINIIVKTE